MDSAPAFVIREYRQKDEDPVLDLLRQTLGEGSSFARTRDFWRWKHFQNPFGASQMLLAVNTEILGLRAFLRWGFRTPRGSVQAVRAVDTSTHPGRRRLGVFTRLTQTSLDRARADGVHLIFNTPNPQSMAGYLKLGWNAVGRPRLLLRPLRPLHMLGALVVRRRDRLAPRDIPGFFRSPAQRVDALFEHRDRLQQILAFNDGLCAEGIRTERSAPFIEWRYAAPPSPQYFALWTGEKPATGILIFRPNIRKGLREIMVCEFLLGYGSGPEARELIGRLAGMVRADYLLAAASPKSHHWKILRRAGFIPLPYRLGPNFVVYPLHWPEGEPDPARLENWQLSLGDLEIF